MTPPSDTKTLRSVKAQFDHDFDATSRGGAVLAEKALRALGLRRDLRKYLPARADAAHYSSDEVAYGLIAGLMVGGRGIASADPLHQDRLLAEIFGQCGRVASDETAYRALCDMAGLGQRNRDDCYEPAGPALASLDMFGAEKRRAQLRRVVPEAPESAAPASAAAFDAFTSRFARKCLRTLAKQTVRVRGWHVVFGDATDLEVEGNCFDAARAGRDGQKHLRWLTMMAGPVTVAQRLAPGNTDEGRAMPDLIAQAAPAIEEVRGEHGRVLGLYDAAYFERQVVDALEVYPNWDFIICANQQRGALERMAAEQPEWVWENSGADARRGWAESQVCCFTHRPEDWKNKVTIVARRWIKQGELKPVWHYAFVATRIQPDDLSKTLHKKHGYCAAIWMLYSTKQGHENHYKTLLRDFGLHHPPSCRMGVNQAFYTIAVAAANAAMVMRYRVVGGEDRGIAFWRLRERYFQIAGRLRRGARRLEVWLAGANVDAERQVLWERAFAAAGRL